MSIYYIPLALLAIAYYAFKKKNYERTSIAYSIILALVIILFGTIIDVVNHFLLLLFTALLLINIIAYLKNKQTYFLLNFDTKSEQMMAGLKDLLKSSCFQSLNETNIILNIDKSCKITFRNVSKDKIKECLSVIDNYINLNKKKFTRSNFFAAFGFPIFVAIILIILRVFDF